MRREIGMAMPEEREKSTDAPGNSTGTGRSAGDRNSDAGPFALIGLGMEFVLTICVMGALGWWMDRKFGTFPWITIAGGAVGFAAGLARMVRAANKAFKN